MTYNAQHEREIEELEVTIGALQDENALLRELVQNYYTEMAIGKQMELAPPETVIEWEQRIAALQKRAEEWMNSDAEAARVDVPMDYTTESGRL